MNAERMRLLFICPTACLGRSGVGDYTRRLAAECVRQGSAAAVVSLNEATVESVSEEVQEDVGTLVPVLRLPATLAWAERWRRASEWRHTAQADVVSLQFVCFGFHPKGLFPMDFGGQIRKLAGGRPVQIMLHELWLGMPLGSSLKYRVWGLLQRWLIKRMLSQLAPEIVHTHTMPYQRALESIGWNAERLPLFGNLPINVGVRDDLYTELERRHDRPLKRGETLLVGVFGNLNEDWHPEPLAKTLSEAGKMLEKQVFIMLMGRHGRADTEVDKWRSVAPSNVVWIDLGERSPVQLSSWFLQLDLGAVGTPWSLLEKSASAATMLEHGVPLLISRDDCQFEGLEKSSADPSRRCHVIDANVCKWIVTSKRMKAVSRLSVVTCRFMEAINGASWTERLKE